MQLVYGQMSFAIGDFEFLSRTGVVIEFSLSLLKIENASVVVVIAKRFLEISHKRRVGFRGEN